MVIWIDYDDDNDHNDDMIIGNYDSFVQTRSEKEEEQEKRYKAEQDQIKHMKTYVAKFGQGKYLLLILMLMLLLLLL